VPESDDKGKPGTVKKPNPSRRETIRQDLKLAENEELAMPPCDAGHMIDYLFEIGPTQVAGMGEAPISHAEIEAWQRNTGIELNSWEARTLRKLSAEYLTESMNATQPQCPAPWRDAPYARPAPNLVALRMQKSLRELTKL